MKKSTKLVTAATVAGLAFVGGSAFTNSNTFEAGATAPLTGYGTTDVSGATVKSLGYNLDGSGANIVSVDLELDTNTTTSTVQVNFNGGTAFDCGAGTYSEIDLATSYTCTPTLVQSTSALTSTGIVVN